MKASICSFVGCESARRVREYCDGHYTQFIRGKELRPLQKKPWAYLNRDERGYKQCPSCDQWMPEDSFTGDSARADSLSHYCRRCYQERQMKTGSGSYRDSILRNRYGISEAQYEALLDEQGGVCAICNRTCPSGKRLAVDHDHACCGPDGSCGWCVRGLLCGSCNRALGLFGDNANRLEAALLYLKGVNA